jgi:hypothetical protein
LKIRRIPGIMNIVEMGDPKEITALWKHPAVDRDFNLRTCPFNWFLLKRSLSVLSFEGVRFPTMTCRDSEQRREAQDRLWTSLNAKSAAIRQGPECLEALAGWVRGLGSNDEVGILAQQLLGGLFSPRFTASAESWAAAEVLVAAPRSPEVLKMVWWFLSGKVSRSKRLLARMAGGDLSAVNAIGIAVHNLVKGIRHMRGLYGDINVRSTLTPKAAARQCLFAPVTLYRQTNADVKLDGHVLPPKSLFVLKIGEASSQEGGSQLVFMDETWSRCPAAQWVPAMLEGLWRRATATTMESRNGAEDIE